MVFDSPINSYCIPSFLVLNTATQVNEVGQK